MSDWQGTEADLIAAELSRVILGGRGPERTEQRMDLFGNLARMTIAHRLVILDVGRQLLPAVRRLVDFVQANPALRAPAEGDQ